MRIAWSTRAMLLPLACATLAACAATDDARVEAAAEQPTTPATEAERLAVTLTEADDAFARGDRQALTGALQRIDALGGHPLDQHAAQLQQWRQAAVPGPPMRGRPLGPGYRAGQLAPGGSEQIEQTFLSGERASIALSSPSKVQLTLHVANGREQSVCGRQGNPSQCNWVPIFTERYRITVTNQTTRPAHYFLVVE